MKVKTRMISVFILAILSMMILSGCSTKGIYTLKDTTLIQREVRGNNFLTRRYFFHFKKDTTEVVFSVGSEVYNTYREGTNFNITYNIYSNPPNLMKMEIVNADK